MYDLAAEWGCRSTKGVNLSDNKALQRGGLVSLQHELFGSVVTLPSCWEMHEPRWKPVVLDLQPSP